MVIYSVFLSFAKNNDYTMKCPKCNQPLTYEEISSGGDGMYFCNNKDCDWFDDLTKPCEVVE